MEVYESTQTESNERVSKVLPSKGSEDVSHLIALKTQETKESYHAVSQFEGYLPNNKVDWVVDMDFNGKSIRMNELKAIFTQKWRESHFQPEIYGIGNGKWTFAFAGDVKDTAFGRLKIALKLVDEYRETQPVLSAADLHKVLQDLRRLPKLMKATISTISTPEEGGVYAQRLSNLKQRCGLDAIIILQSDGGAFLGKTIWDAMLSLGLRWGDMDLFHYENEGAFEGDDHLFSVWTATEPGYFLPEEIAAGRMNPENLIFGFKVSRTERPMDICHSMVKAAEYCQKRLGGKLLNAEGNNFVSDTLFNAVKSVEDRLVSNGFVPGRNESLLLF